MSVFGRFSALSSDLSDLDTAGDMSTQHRSLKLTEVVYKDGLALKRRRRHVAQRTVAIHHRSRSLNADYRNSSPKAFRLTKGGTSRKGSAGSSNQSHYEKCPRVDKSNHSTKRITFDMPSNEKENDEWRSPMRRGTSYPSSFQLSEGVSDVTLPSSRERRRRSTFPSTFLTMESGSEVTLPSRERRRSSYSSSFEPVESVSDITLPSRERRRSSYRSSFEPIEGVSDITLPSRERRRRRSTYPSSFEPVEGMADITLPSRERMRTACPVTTHCEHDQSGVPVPAGETCKTICKSLRKNQPLSHTRSTQDGKTEDSPKACLALAPTPKKTNEDESDDKNYEHCSLHSLLLCVVHLFTTGCIRWLLTYAFVFFIASVAVATLLGRSVCIGPLFSYFDNQPCSTYWRHRDTGPCPSLWE